jgi:hypothetical protein
MDWTLHTCACNNTILETTLRFQRPKLKSKKGPTRSLHCLGVCYDVRGIALLFVVHNVHDRATVRTTLHRTNTADHVRSKLEAASLQVQVRHHSTCRSTVHRDLRVQDAKHATPHLHRVRQHCAAGQGGRSLQAPVQLQSVVTGATTQHVRQDHLSGSRPRHTVRVPARVHVPRMTGEVPGSPQQASRGQIQKHMLTTNP